MDRRGGGADNSTTVLTLAGLAAVTLTSAVSAYRAAAAGDVGSAAFVGTSYAALLLLSRSLHAYAYADLVKVGMGVVACNAALTFHQTAGGGDEDASSLASVFVAYAGFLTLTWLFLHRFDDSRARAAGQ